MNFKRMTNINWIKFLKRSFNKLTYDYDAVEDLNKFDFLILSKIEDENFMYVVPLNFKAFTFVNSYKCGGEGAKWCIGTKKDKKWYDDYFIKHNNFAIVALSKQREKNNIKTLYIISNGTCYASNQVDTHHWYIDNFQFIVDAIPSVDKVLKSLKNS